MLVHAKRDELLTLAAQAGKAVPKKTSEEELKGIHIDADARRSVVTMTSTNHEIVIRTTMGAVVEQSGSAVINASLFSALLALLPEEDVDLELLRPTQIHIHSGTCDYHLSVLPGEKYPMPELPFPDDTVPVSGICTLARNTLFAASEDNNNAVLRCIRLVLGASGLTASGTNGFCIVEAEGDKNCTGEVQMLLPARSLKVLASLSLDSDVYEMGLTGNSVVFWNGSMLFSARLMKGRFPDTTGLINSFQPEYSVHVDAAELARAIDTVSTFSGQERRMEMAFGEHQLYVSALAGHGQASAPVNALILNAPDTPFYYNYDKLLDCLSVAKGKVTLEFDKKGLLVVRLKGVRYLQSPMRAPRKAASSQKAA